MEHLIQQVQRAYQDLSALAHGNTSADIMMARVAAFELITLKEAIDDAIFRADQRELERCLEKCRQLQSRVQAVQKLVEHDGYREREESITT